MKDRSMSNNELFCFFTGSTKGMVDIIDIKSIEELKILHFSLSIPNEITWENSRYVQLDGVLCEVLDFGNKVMTVSTTYELIENTTLKNVSKGKKVSLGLLAEFEPNDSQYFLIQPSANTLAKVEGISILAGHQYTLKIDLSCDSSKTIELEEEKHAGFSGSSLLVRELKKEEGLSRFSIYAGKQTQEKTCFNKKLIQVGNMVNITLPKINAPAEISYPYELKSLKPNL